MDYQTKTNLILPFSGTIMCSNGGRTPETNNHNRPPEQGPQNQLYAYDFRDQRTATGKEKNWDEFDIFGTEIITPGAGKIIQVITGAIDVAPGERDRAVGAGNTVIIDHANGEYSVLCQF